MGTTLIDEVSYKAEGWACRDFGGAVYWQARLAGLSETATASAEERSRRKRAFATSREREADHKAWIDRLVEAER